MLVHVKIFQFQDILNEYYDIATQQMFYLKRFEFFEIHHLIQQGNTTK